MKPIKLVLNAFGSFLEKTEIDFNILNSSGFYLITGATGSGKTTIFDAIMFALYGEASGDTRTSEGFRSDFADDKNPTYVEFTFEKDNIIYKVTRSPRYSVSYRQTPIDSKASIEFENKVVEKTNLVNEKINEILGLTAPQFRQVIMLAQGEFMKLIHAKSSERDEIFRKIFGTEVFEKVSRLLKEETKEVKEKLKLNEELIKRTIINIPDIREYNNYAATMVDLNNIKYLLEELEEKIKSSNTLMGHYDTILEMLSKDLIELGTYKETAKLINDDFNKLKQEVEKQDLLNQQIETINLKEKQVVILNEVAKLKPAYDKLININLQVNILSKTYETNKAILEEKQEALNFFIDQTNMIELDKLSLENIKKTKTEIEKNIEVKKELENKETLISSFEQQIIRINREIDIIAKEQTELTSLIDELNEQITALGKYKLEYEITLKEIESHNKVIKEFSKNNILYQESNKITKDISSLVDTYQDLLNGYNNAYQKYLKLEQIYFNNLAGVLGKELKEGIPCPVCGSTTHPNIAVVTSDFVTKESLDKEYEALELLRVRKDAKLLEIESLKAKLDVCNNQLLENLNITDIKDIDSKLSEISTLHKEKQLELIKYKETCIESINKLNELENKLKEKTNKFKENENKTLNQKETLTNVNNSLSSLKGAIETLETQLTFSNSIEELELAKEERIQAIEMLEEAILGFEKEYDLVKEEYQLIKAWAAALGFSHTLLSQAGRR